MALLWMLEHPKSGIYLYHSLSLCLCLSVYALCFSLSISEINMNFHSFMDTFQVLCKILLVGSIPTGNIPDRNLVCGALTKKNIRNKVITFLITIMQTKFFLNTFFESSSRLFTTSYRRDPQTKFKLVRYLCGTEPEGTILHNTIFIPFSIVISDF